MISPDSEYEGLSDHLGKKSHKTDQIIHLYVIFLPLLHYLAEGIQTVIENLNFKQ